MGAVPHLGRAYFVEKFGVVDFSIMSPMKFWFIAILIFVVAFIVYFPLVNKERLCYEASQTTLDDINSDVIARGIPKSTQCERSTDALYALETCIRDATKSSTVALYANDTIQRIVAIIRPYGNNVWTLKAEHNETCAEFSRYQFP